MNPIEKYYTRFLTIRPDEEKTSSYDGLMKLIEEESVLLNNFFMAGLGLSTLMLRMGAVILMCRKLDALDDQGDALFMKQVLDNLRETLPSDTNWKNLWIISASEEQWIKPTIQPKGGQSLLDRFVTFRNRFVHQQIRIIPEHIKEISKGIVMLDEFAELTALFSNGDLEIKNNKFYWKTKDSLTALYPYLQAGIDKESPYIFQGLHDHKTSAHLLNTNNGDETEQDSTEHLEPVFEPLRNALRGGAGQVFDHSERISYYRSCFVGRDRERDEILKFTTSNDEKNILCVKSAAGMGKGALVADVIHQLKQQRTQLLYHFCGAGLQNSLHATLYHLILQGKDYWDRSDETIKRKLDRLPSKYIDLIHLFQSLISEQLIIQRKNESGNLVIIIDGLDEAQVAYSQLKISDWFYTYNEKEEPEEDWRSSSNIRWIFTYRCENDGSESFYRFPNMKECTQIEILQPLQGLSPEAVDEAFKDFNVSKEFQEVVIQRAQIS